MTRIVLACSWYPRGEMVRFQRYLPRLRSLYDDVVVAVSQSDADFDVITEWLHAEQIPFEVFEGWSGRHVCVRLAVQHGADFIQYADLDRLLHWVECYPDELADVVDRLSAQDLLILGRTADAWATHPRSMFESEALFNTVFSDYFGREMDFGAGSRGLSRAAAEFVLRHSGDGDALAMDAGWSVLLKRGGFQWDYAACDGLEWETADQYHDTAADQAAQSALAEESDSKTAHWALRVQVARKIIHYGIQAMNHDLSEKDEV